MVGILTQAHLDRKAFLESHFITDMQKSVELTDLIKGATPEQSEKVKKVMSEWKGGKLKSGSGGKVTDQKQAIAIALNESGLHKSNSKEDTISKCDHSNMVKGKCVDCGYVPDKLKKDDNEEEAGNGGEEDQEKSVKKAIENLFGKQEEVITDPIEKAFNDVLQKGGEGSNKAGRVIGTTRSGKPVHSLKAAHEYKDFEAVDHEEAYKMHMNHSHKVQGVAAVNSRIRAHDHGDQAQIKASKAEQEELEAKNGKMGKEIQAKEKMKQMGTGVKKPGAAGAKKKPATAKKPVKKSEEDELEKGDISNSMSGGYYGGDKENLRFNKSGKEMISKLRKLGTNVDALINDLEAKMTAEEETVGNPPDSENTSYNIKGLKCPRYSYDYCWGYGPKSDANIVVETAVAIPVKKEEVDTKARTVQQACQRYNDLSSQLLSALEDEKTISLLRDNLEPGKKYSLSIAQLAILGF